MATIVCQGLQSCLESQLVESRTLRLKLSSPKPHFSQSLELALKANVKEVHHHHDEIKHTSSSSIQNPDMGGWSFLEALQNTSKESVLDKENVYVHPLIKRNSSALSEKSLELCTENLGSETGTIDIIDNTIFSPSLTVSESEAEAEEGNSNSPAREQQQQPRQLSGARKANCIRSFPPPLTTISGSEPLQFRPHREEGRLIIKAVKAPSQHSCFQADRSEGRLRLSFVQDSALNVDLDEENEETNVAKNDKQETENDAMNSDEVEEVEEEEEEEDFEVEKENNGAYYGKEIEGNNLDVGAEIGKEEFQRPRRCKEDELENKAGLLNWEPFWVAT